MKVLVARPGEKIREEEIEGSLESMQKLVGGYIEIGGYILSKDRLEENAIICNEEGMIWNLPIQRAFGRMFAGTVFLCGVDGENFCDVSEKIVKECLICEK